MASDQPVVPPVADVPEQGAAAGADTVSSSAQDTSSEGDAVSTLSATPSTTPSSAPDVAQPAEAKPKAKANPTYEDAQGPAEFAQYILFQMQQRGTADPGQLVKAIEACIARKFDEFTQAITDFQERSRQQEAQWREKEREWQRLDEAHKTAAARLETTLRAELADKVEREKGEAAERDKAEAVEQERAWWQGAMDTLNREKKEELTRAEARAQRLSDEIDAAARDAEDRANQHQKALQELRREHRADVARVSDLQSEMQGGLRETRRANVQLQREAGEFRDTAQRELDRRVAELQDHNHPEKIKMLKHKYRLLEQEVEAKKEELARERDEISARWEKEAENLGVQHEEELTEYRDRVSELKRTRREEQEAWRSARAEEEKAAAAAAQREQRLSRRLRELGQDPRVVAATSPTGPEAPPNTLAHELSVPGGGDFGGDDDDDDDDVVAGSDEGPIVASSDEGPIVAGSDEGPDAAAAGAGQEEFDRLREAHEALQRENDDLTTQLNRVRGIAEELKYNMEQDEEKRAAAGQHDLEQIREAMIDSVRDEIARLEGSKRQAEERRLQAENERATTVQEKAALKAEKDELKNLISALEQKNQTQAAQLASLRDMAQQLQKAIEGDDATRAAAMQTLQAQIRDAMENLQRAKLEKEALQGRATALAAQVNALRADAVAQQREHEEAEARFEAQRATAVKNTRAVVEKLDAAKKAVEATLAAANRDKADLEEKLRRLGDGGADIDEDTARALAELTEYRDAVVRALDVYDTGLARAQRAAALAGEPDTLGELEQLVERDYTAIEALHRRTVEAAQRQAQASSSSGNGNGDAVEQREQTAAKVARIGGELTKIRGIRTRLSLDDALLAALRRRQQQPQSEGEGEEEEQEEQRNEGGGTEIPPPMTAGVAMPSRRPGGLVVTPFVAVQVVTLVLCLAATAAEGHRYSLWRVANATTRAMMAEGQYYTCVGVQQPAYFADWLLKVLRLREWDPRDYM